MRKLMMIAMIALMFTIGANTLRAQDIMCKSLPPEYRVITLPQVITADNVQQICTRGANPGRIIEARWHKTEPILVLWDLPDFSVKDQTISHIAVWDVEQNRGTRFRTRGRVFSQLEVADNTLVVGSKAGNLLLWDLRQEVFLFVIPVHDGAVSELLLHPSDEWILVVINQKELFRYDLQLRTVTQVHLQEGEDLPLHALAFSNNGRLLAAAGIGYVGIWNTNDFAARQPVASTSESAVSLHFFDNDSQLILLTDESVSSWSLAGTSLEFVRNFEPLPDSRHCAFLGGDINLDGSLLMTTDECGQLRAWNLNLDEEIHIPQLSYVGEDRVGVPTRFSPDGRYLVDRSEPYGFSVLIVPEYDYSLYPRHNGGV